MKNGKRILSVKIKREIDDCPDTSFYGEYSNRPTSEFSIDRAHAEDCILNDAKQCEKLKRIAEYLDGLAQEEVEKCDCADRSWYGLNHDSACPVTYSDADAIGTAMEQVTELAECDCGERGDMRRNEYRYFNPSFNYVDKNGKPSDGLTAEEVRKYVRQDYDRMEKANRGDWCMLVIGCVAEISIPSGQSSVTSDVSAWVGGIESDCEDYSVCKDPRHASPCGHDTKKPCQACAEECNPKYLKTGNYLRDIEEEQMSEVKAQLTKLGFSKRAIATAFKNVTEEN